MGESEPLSSFPFRFGSECLDPCGREDENESSDDELDIILHGTPEQKRRLTRSLSRGSLQMSSSEDEFEKEMELELDATMKRHERQFVVHEENQQPSGSSSTGMQEGQPTACGASTSGSTATHAPASHQFYDNMYFDSDEDEEEEKKTSKNEGAKSNAASGEKKEAKRKHPIPSNDELLYDPDIDEDNQNWMDKRRAQYYPKGKSETSGISKPNRKGALSKDGSKQASQKASSEIGKDEKQQVPKTDAVLNCPACMTTLCIDCQRHEIYTNQYRAMFVMNCCILRSEQLRYPASKKKRFRKRRRHEEGEEGHENVAGVGPLDSDELYHPVKCSICNTEVAVVDKDEIFHFFNVLTGAA